MSARINHGDVLDRWHGGETSRSIAAALNLKGPHTVRVIVQRARERGDSRAIARRRSPGPSEEDRVTVVLQGFSMVPRLRDEAERRQVSIATLVNGLLEAIVIDKLYSAILDDEKENLAPRKAA